MKNLNSFIVKTVLSLAVVSFAFVGCQKPDKLIDGVAGLEKEKGKPIPSESSCADYLVDLNVTQNAGSTEFVWTIINPNPGNGKNGTLQNLSHWGFSAAGCEDPALNLENNWSDVLAAYYFDYSLGEWVEILPTPEVKPDPSMSACTNDPMVKYDYGTTGDLPSLYKLVLAGHWGTSKVTGYFKSGANTGCCEFQIDGIGCKDEDSQCSFSQGFFFASPHAWAVATVTVGGFEYTEAEGRAIWNTSNAGGIKDSKKGFTQVAAIKLSGVTDALVLEKVAIIESWLATVGKLSAANLPNQTAQDILTYGDAAAAAGWIGDWINENHCADDDYEE
ncbi:hypothetical protein [Gaoshiqia sp. Z1-71]|uniref:hypothetical protein n=1 Tax=Gaoshiqia hydrogeniformans TaxID=3290090 RepID=UPI003BF8DF6A